MRYGHLIKPSEERGTLHLIALSLSPTFIIAICHFVLVVSTHDVSSSTEAFISISRHWSVHTQAKGCTGRAHWNATRSIDSPSYCTHKAIGTEYNGRYASSIRTFSRLKKQAYSKVLSALWKVARNIFSCVTRKTKQVSMHCIFTRRSIAVLLLSSYLCM